MQWAMKCYGTVEYQVIVVIGKYTFDQIEFLFNCVGITNIIHQCLLLHKDHQFICKWFSDECHMLTFCDIIHVVTFITSSFPILLFNLIIWFLFILINISQSLLQNILLQKFVIIIIVVISEKVFSHISLRFNNLF